MGKRKKDFGSWICRENFSSFVLIMSNNFYSKNLLRVKWNNSSTPPLSHKDYVLNVFCYILKTVNDNKHNVLLFISTIIIIQISASTTKYSHSIYLKRMCCLSIYLMVTFFYSPYQAAGRRFSIYDESTDLKVFLLRFI